MAGSGRGLLSGNTPRQKGGAGKTQAYVVHCGNKADYRGGGGGGLELNKDATGVTQNNILFFKQKISDVAGEKTIGKMSKGCW